MWTLAIRGPMLFVNLIRNLELSWLRAGPNAPKSVSTVSKTRIHFDTLGFPCARRELFHQDALALPQFQESVP